MSEQEQQAALRAELLAGIKGALSGPGVPAAPVNPGPNATPAQREVYEAAVRDSEVHAILGKDAGEVTKAERDRVNKEILDCLKRGW
jgi:hypothetical protein